ncbi:hypothetical protein ACFV7Q_38195 [Streptomyces sp. NPDC059851]|uniref:hypothetical protein n=1 Tax=Streptomyces sp. NPDC059851 TaxID=3346971 RepID=UPI00364B089D
MSRSEATPEYLVAAFKGRHQQSGSEFFGGLNGSNGAESCHQAVLCVVRDAVVSERGQQQQESAVWIGCAATGQPVVGGRKQLGPGQGRTHKVPVVLGQQQCPLPAGVMQEIVDTRVVLPRAVDDVDEVPGGQRDGEDGPLRPLPQLPMEHLSRLVVRTEEQLFRVLIVRARVQVAKPEERFLQQHWLVDERVTVVPGISIMPIIMPPTRLPLHGWPPMLRSQATRPRVRHHMMLTTKSHGAP